MIRSSAFWWLASELRSIRILFVWLNPGLVLLAADGHSELAAASVGALENHYLEAQP